MIEITDALGRTLHFETRPKRIVSLVPSVTETLFDLGMWTQVVGVTRYCVHPKNATSTRQVVGGTKQVNFDKIAACRPDLILCNQEENTPEIINTLDDLGLTTYVAFPKNIEDALNGIRTLGLLNETPSIATTLIESIEESITNCPQKSFTYLYLIWKKPWMICGEDTFIHQMLATIGGVNLAPQGNRYLEISELELCDSVADVLFLSSEPYPFESKHLEQLVDLGIPRSKIQFINGEYCSWHGTRIAKAIPYLSKWRLQQSF